MVEAKQEKPAMKGWHQDEEQIDRKSGTRDRLQAELIGIARDHFARFDTFDLIKEDKEHEHQARVTVIEGMRATLIKFNGKGLQIDKIKEFFQPEAMEHRLRTLGEGRINFCNLGTDDGRRIRHF